jgi:NADH-quinone oxidoreductase subunit E
MDSIAIDKIIDKYDRDPSSLLAILQDVQAHENWVPKEAVTHIAKRLEVSEARVYGMATFYRAFSLKPRGKHICTVCMGTACHVRGAPRLVEQLERDFTIKAGETTPDMKVTIETVNCVGACALGPLVLVNGEYHGNMDLSKLGKVVRGIKKEGAK